MGVSVYTVVYLEVESLKASSAEAKNDVDDRVNKLLLGLGKFNVDEKNVSASSISTAPEYSFGDNEKRVLDGYRASRNLKVTLNNLEHLNAFMDFALSVQLDEITRVELKSSKEAELKMRLEPWLLQMLKKEEVYWRTLLGLLLAKFTALVLQQMTALAVMVPTMESSELVHVWGNLK